MRPHFLALSVVLSSVALADGFFIQRAKPATLIGHPEVSIVAGKTYSFRAWSDDSDPVMHLWSPTSKVEVGWSDDAIGRNPRVTYPAPSTGSLVILVRSYYGFGSGSGTISYCTHVPTQPDRCNEAPTPGKLPLHPEYWLTLYTGDLQGTRVEPMIAMSSPGFLYQTAKVNEQWGGTNDTMLLAIDSSQHLMYYDDDSGVGAMSATRPLVGTQFLILTAWAVPGSADVISNDAPASDFDGDGLGTMLENEVGTCDTEVPSSSSRWYCAGRELARRRDSDRDGLKDSIEVLGLETAGESLDFAAWGANPLRKDIFLEQDYALKVACPVADNDCWHPSVTGNPFTEDMAAEVARSLAEGDEDEWLNVTGAGKGAAVHFDLGRACSTAHAQLCGAWGGGGDGIAWTGPASRKINPGRLGLFRTLMIYPSGGSTPRPGDIIHVGIAGFSPPGSPPWTRGYSHPFGVIHELGHSLNLQHGGDEEINCKPNYLSVMAYTSNEFLVGFSHGTRLPLDPGRLVEPKGMGADATALADERTNYWFPVADAVGSVDFNRSGVLDTSRTGFLRAGATIPGTWASCAASTRVRRYVAEAPEGTMSLASPDLVEVAGRLWVFRVDGNVVRYKSVAHSGANGKGGCTVGSGGLGAGSPGEACHDWASETETKLPGTGTAPISGVSALVWNGKLVVAWVETPAGSPTSNLWTIMGNPVGAGGMAFGPRRLVATNLLADTEVELSEMFVDPARYAGADRLLSAFFVERQDATASYYVWQGSTDGINWTRHEVRDVGLNWMPARRAPGVTTWPHRSVEVPAPQTFGFACGAFGVPRVGDWRDDLGFYCFRKDLDRWELMSPLRADFAHVSRRPSVMWHTFREAPRTPDEPALPLNGDATYGQFFLEVSMSGNAKLSAPLPADPGGAAWNSVLMTSRGHSRTSPPVAGAVQLSVNGYTWDQWTSPTYATSAAFFENGSLSSMKGLFLTRRQDPDFSENVRGDKLVFLPFVDGTFHANLRDVNDFHVMERGVCLGLHGDASGACGSLNIWGY